MTVALFAAGLQTGVVGSEVFLSNVNEVGRFSLHVDISSLVTGTAVELRGYQTILNSGTARVVYFSNYQGVQPTDGLIIVSEPIANELVDPQALRFSLKQTIGPALTFAWKVLNIDKFPANFPALGISSLGHISNVDLVGQVTGSAMSLVSGTSGGGTFDPALVWSFTGTRSLNGDQIWNLSGSIGGNLLGYVGQVTGSAMSLVSGAAASFDPALVWSFTGTRSLNGIQIWNLSGSIAGNLLGYVGQVTGSAMSLISGAAASFDPATVWSFTGSRALNGLQSWNLIGNVSGTVTNNFNQSQILRDMVAMFKENERAVMGNVYYVDGLRGNDITGDGTRNLPFKTITRALIPAVDHNHDGIFLLPMPTGTNTITETGTIVINKADVQIWGPGYDVLVTNIPAVNRDVFDIRAEGVGLHQFRLTAAGNSANGVTFSNGAALGLLSHMWIESVTQDGISINVGTRNRILNSSIQGVGRDGIRINSGAGTGTYNVIENNTIRSNILNGINLQGADASNTRIQGNAIRDNIGFGVLIAAGAANTILTDNRIFNNTLGNLSDAGTNTLQQWNFFDTDVVGIPLAVYNLVSGSVVADRVWQYTGTRALQGVQVWNLSGSIGGNLLGYVGRVTGSVLSVISGTAATIDPSQVWTFTGARTLSSPQNFDLIGNISGTIVGLNVTVTGVSINPAAIWSYAVRTLTYPVFPAPPVQFGNNLTVYRGDTWSIALTGLGSLANSSKVYFTVKRLYTDKDVEAVVQVSDVNGLLVINGGPAVTAADGSITINNAASGDITIVVKAVETAKLDLLKDIYYDIQLVRNDGTVQTLVAGNFTILGDSSRATT